MDMWGCVRLRFEIDSLGCSFCCETHPGAKGSNGNGSICNSTTVAHFAYGIATCVFAVLLYGTNLVPVKIIETGDGKYFLSVDILCSNLGVSMTGDLMLHSPKFYPFAMLGGLLTFPFIWPTGNVAVVPIIKAIGIGLGFLCLSCLFLVVDLLYSSSFVPIFYIKKHSLCQDSAFYGASVYGMVSTFLYCGAMNSKPRVLLSGLMWALATHSWFLANNYLSSVITFPIVTAGYDLIAALWGSLVLREIKVCIKALATVNNLGLVVLMLSVSAQFRKYDFTDLKLNCSPTEGISDFERKKVCLNFSKTLSW
uniref:Transmembrane protein 144b n=1 Tax=Amphiprion ocellaris TaxID=80972 RepID=A0AAQ5Z1J1_AMPOC